MNKHLTEKVVHAVWQHQLGCPIKDYLSDGEIIEALSMLADILVCIGVPIKEVEEWA